MADEVVLSRFGKLPTKDHGTALFVGIKGIGKHRLAQTINECNTEFPLQIRTATALPLPNDHQNLRPRIDYVTFFIDLENKLSFDVVKLSVKSLAVDYFLGRCCFILTNAKKEECNNVDIQDVIEFANVYDSPIICADLKSKDGQRCLAQKLLQRIKPACGYHGDVTPLLLDTTRQIFGVDDTFSAGRSSQNENASFERRSFRNGTNRARLAFRAQTGKGTGVVVGTTFVAALLQKKGRKRCWAFQLATKKMLRQKFVRR